MKLAGYSRHLVSALLIAVIGYAVFFYAIEHRRTHNGPWQVAFACTNASPPTLIIHEPRLNIANLKITFPRQTAPPTSTVILFDQPREIPFDLPYGKCVFMDALTMPGTVTMVMFGHEIQLLPRVLTIDKKEYPWQSDATIEVTP